MEELKGANKDSFIWNIEGHSLLQKIFGQTKLKINRSHINTHNITPTASATKKCVRVLIYSGPLHRITSPL